MHHQSAFAVFHHKGFGGQNDTAIHVFITGHSNCRAPNIGLFAVGQRSKLVWIAQNISPAFDDGLALSEPRPTGVNAEHRVLPGPEGIHGVDVFACEGHVKSVCGKQGVRRIHEKTVFMVRPVVVGQMVYRMALGDNSKEA